MEDFNINILDDDNNFSILLSEFDYISTINTITRPESGGCLDHVLYKGTEKFDIIGASCETKTMTTDHFPAVKVWIKQLNTPKRKLKHFLYMMNYEHLERTDWTFHYGTENTDIMVTILLQNLSERIEQKYASRGIMWNGNHG